MKLLVRTVFLAGGGSSFVNGHDFVVVGGASTTVFGGWSSVMALRANLASSVLKLRSPNSTG
jgi:hypothetical protein